MNKAVTIITGFLGAGKTTFLNHLLEQQTNTRYAIIENEFGEQGIDNELVITPDDSIIELNSGCLCCTLNDNLYDVLNELHSRRDEYDEIIIEATGVADPTGLAEPFIIHPMVKKHFTLRAVICLVDAELIEDHLRETEEAINQITFSDIILINKTDLVSQAYLPELGLKLQRLNPLAKVLQGHKDQFPEMEYQDDQQKLEQLFAGLKKEMKFSQEALNLPIPKPHSHHHHDHTQDVVSHTFTFDQAFDPVLLDRHLFVYLTFQSKGLYRMKGLIWLAGEDSQYLLQSVGKRLDIEVKRPWGATEERKSVLVFIGKNIQRAGLQKLLDKCLPTK